MPITTAQKGKAFEIKKLTGRDDTKRFLESLGFVVGETITVISEINGNMIVTVKESRIAIDKTMANRIMV